MRIKELEYLRKYKLKLIFSDNKAKIVDLEDMLANAKGIFLPLKDIEYFKKVAIDDCQLSICWPNGADICPDVLYSIGQEMKEKSLHIMKTKRKSVSRPAKVHKTFSS